MEHMKADEKAIYNYFYASRIDGISIAYRDEKGELQFHDEIRPELPEGFYDLFRQMSKVWYDGQASLSFYWHDFENDKFRRKSKYSARMYSVNTVENKTQNQINY